MPFQVKSQTAIFNDAANRTLGRTDLSAITPNSQVYQFHMGQAAELALFYLNASQMRTAFDIRKATGDDLDERVEELPLSSPVRRLGPQQAIGKVAFFRAGVTGTIVIPAGSLVKFRNGQSATTLEATAITPTSAAVVMGHAVGRDSGIVLAVASSPGSSGNADPGDVVGLAGPIPGISGVVGMTPFRGGSDREPGPELLARALNEVKSLGVGSPSIIEAATTGVVDALTGKQAKYTRLVEDIANLGVSFLYVDDGFGQSAQFGTPVVDILVASAFGGEILFQITQWPVSTAPTNLVLKKNTIPLVLGVDFFFRPTDGMIRLAIPLAVGDSLEADYVPYIGLLKTVQKVIDGDPTNPTVFPGVRAGAGIVRALPARLQFLTIVGTVVMDSLSPATQSAISSAVLAQTISYVTSLGIEAEFVPSELNRLLKSITNSRDVVLTEINDGVTNTVIRKRPGPYSVYRTDASRVQIQVVLA